VKRLRRTAFLLRRSAREPADRRRPAAWFAEQRDRGAQAIARFAAERVPWYGKAMASHGFSPADIRSADDLARLPIVQPSYLAAHPEDFLPRGANREDWIELKTSGTSGAPRTIWHDPDP